MQADTYGSRVQKNNGGIMHNFANYAHDDGSNVSVPRSFQARPHSDQVNLAYITPEEQGILQALKPDTPHEGPMGIPNYDSFDVAGNYSSGAAMSAAETGGKTDRDRRDMAAAGISPQQAQNIRSGAIAAGAGQTVNPGWFGPRHRPGISKQDLRAAKAFAPNAYRATRGSPFGIGNLFRGAMSMFGGWPGKIGSMFSHIDPRQLRGKNLDGSWRTQREWEEARNLRRDIKRMAYLSDRRKRGLDFGDQAYADLLAQGIEDPFQSAIDADYEREGDDLYLQNPSKNYLSTIDLSKYADPAPPYDDSNFPGIENRDMQKYLEDETNFNNQGIRSIDTIANEYPPGNWKG